MINRISWTERVLVHAVLILFAVIAVFPFLWLLSTSFKPAAEIFTSEIHLVPETFTWENYQYLFAMKDNLFLKWIWNSVFVALLTTVLAVFLSATTAYALSRFNFPGKRGVMYSFLLTQMFPAAILIVPLYNLIKNLGLLNSYTGLILAYMTTALPFCVWMLKSYFDSIPVELEEAAKVDGLNTWGTFYRIVLPLALPGLAVTGFFAFITAWNEFLFALTFMSEQSAYTLPVGLRTFVFQFRTDWHYMSAGAVLITIPVLLFFAVAQRWLVSGLTAGGSKG
ncbi:carbohydrate ABC transporter permease [Tumebacillus sp. DT12]|uniref:Carbohydrate ABC transporter permease n=1 Tax=Tumebacillus lacus TaxID=2995335 RepID=A0ABT3X2M9_9BACL|nr:carbohydrate ABC transporter permease [Tumebacillus lacus]MCX7571164.1 carbohydrate ABC transporter permease [Tumebacillus lacus]